MATVTPGASSPSASPSPSPIPSDEQISSVSTEVCEGEAVYNFESAPYKGDGPHPMTVVVPMSSAYSLELPSILLPDRWDPVGGGDAQAEPNDPRHDEIQLVVCDDAVATGDVIGTCEYDEPGSSGTMDVVEAEHTLVVREARTGRHITELTLQGSASAQESCPAIVMDYGTTQIAQALNDDIVAAELRIFYQGKAKTP